MYRILGMALYLLLCTGLAACDGFYAYRYEGQLLQDSSGVPAKNVPVLVTSSKPNSPEQTQITSWDGRFKGVFLTGTGWVTVFRPPPPKMRHVFLSYEWNGQWHVHDYGENEFEQSVVKSEQGFVEERVIRLPPLVISPTSPH